MDMEKIAYLYVCMFWSTLFRPTRSFRVFKPWTKGQGETREKVKTLSNSHTRMRYRKVKNGANVLGPFQYLKYIRLSFKQRLWTFSFLKHRLWAHTKMCSYLRLTYLRRWVKARLGDVEERFLHSKFESEFEHWFFMFLNKNTQTTAEKEKSFPRDPSENNLFFF